MATDIRNKKLAKLMLALSECEDLRPEDEWQDAWSDLKESCEDLCETYNEIRREARRNNAQE